VKRNKRGLTLETDCQERHKTKQKAAKGENRAVIAEIRKLEFGKLELERVRKGYRGRDNGVEAGGHRVCAD
jgi:hypothetical protein